MEAMASDEACPIPGDETAWNAWQTMLRALDGIPDSERPLQTLKLLTAFTHCVFSRVAGVEATTGFQAVMEAAGRAMQETGQAEMLLVEATLLPPAAEIERAGDQRSRGSDATRH